MFGLVTDHTHPVRQLFKILKAHSRNQIIALWHLHSVVLGIGGQVC